MPDRPYRSETYLEAALRAARRRKQAHAIYWARWALGMVLIALGTAITVMSLITAAILLNMAP